MAENSAVSQDAVIANDDRIAGRHDHSVDVTVFADADPTAPVFLDGALHLAQQHSTWRFLLSKAEKLSDPLR